MRRRPLLPLALLLGALLAAGCGESDGTRAADTTPRPTSSATPDGAGSSSPEPTPWPAFEPADYVYRLEVLCFCPLLGPVRVTVEDGEVVSARSISGETRGEEAPEYARLTIDDIIARANDPRVAKADVTWPDGQDHPSTVAIDQIANATDDEVTYTIRNVRVSGE